MNINTPVVFEKWIQNPNNKKEIKLYDFTKQDKGTLKRHSNKKSLV